MPQPVLQSVPVLRPPEPSGAYEYGEHTRYAQVSVAAGDGGTAKRVGSSEEPHVAPLDSHLSGRLELPGAAGGPAKVQILLDSGTGASGISEDVYQQLRQQWPRVELTRPYDDGMKAQVADGQVVALEQKTVPLHPTLTSS